MRIFAFAAVVALIGLVAGSAVAGQGCIGYKPAKVTYPTTALEPVAPQTPVPSSATGG